MIYQKITVDITENNLPPVVYVKQGDTARGVEIALTDGGVPYIPQSIGALTVNIRKADGTVNMLPATITDDGTIKADFSEQTLAAAGRAVGDATMYATDGTLLTSFLFFLRVVDSAVPSDKITSSDEYAALADLLVKLTNADEAANVALLKAQEALKLSQNCSQAEAARVAAENQRVEAETARSTAESNRTTEEQKRITAENQRVEAETARSTAESNRTTEEQKRITAENARQEAETARSTAESNRTTEEQKRITAENARQEAETARSTAESIRVAAETERKNAENTRNQNETERQTAETARAKEYAQISERLSSAIGSISEAIQAAEDIKTLYEKMNVVLYTDESGDLWIDEATEVK